jgi:hypothetical protein
VLGAIDHATKKQEVKLMLQCAWAGFVLKANSRMGTPRERPRPMKKPMKEEAISAGIDRMVVMPLTCPS